MESLVQNIPILSDGLGFVRPCDEEESKHLSTMYLNTMAKGELFQSALTLRTNLLPKLGYAVPVRILLDMLPNDECTYSEQLLIYLLMICDSEVKVKLWAWWLWNSAQHNEHKRATFENWMTYWGHGIPTEENYDLTWASQIDVDETNRLDITANWVRKENTNA